MTVKFIPEPAPQQYDPEWVERQFRNLQLALLRTFDLDASRQVERPRQGMVRFFDSTVYDPGAGTGLYVYVGSAWTKV